MSTLLTPLSDKCLFWKRKLDFWSSDISDIINSQKQKFQFLYGLEPCKLLIILVLLIQESLFRTEFQCSEASPLLNQMSGFLFVVVIFQSQGEWRNDHKNHGIIKVG